MKTDRPDKLIAMANQIGRFFISQPGNAAVAGVADHLRAFWDPSMRTRIVAWVDAEGTGLDPAVRQAIELLRDARPGEVRAILAEQGGRSARRAGDDAG